MNIGTHSCSFRVTLSLIPLLASSLSGAAATSEVARALQPFVDRHELAGAVMLVATKDKVVDLETVGYADIAAKKSMSKGALFWIASMS